MNARSDGGARPVSVDLHPELHDRLQHLAIDERATVTDLLQEAPIGPT